MCEFIKVVPATKQTDYSKFVSFTKNLNHRYLINLVVRTNKEGISGVPHRFE